MRWRNVYRLGLKEMVSLRHDPVLVLLIVYAFTVSVIAPARGVKLELVNASVAIVDEDRSQLSQRIADSLRAPYFQAPAQIDFGQVDDAMDAGRYTFVIDLPPRFQADLTEGRRPSVQVAIDATAMTQAGAGARYIEQVLQQEVREHLGDHGPDAAQPVTTVTRLMFNPNSDSTRFVAVMQLINMSTLLGILLTGAALIREREHGTLEHLLVMPLRPVEIMLAKIWSNALVILVAATLSVFLVLRGVLDVPLTGSVPLFLLGLAAYLTSLTAIGILLATVARSMPQFGLLSIPVFLVMYMLSGANTPLESMPEFLQRVMQVSPTTHIVAFTQSVVFRGAGLDTVWPQLLATALIGALAFAVALARFRRTVTLSQS
jgi:ABC-2 type transport system permease protein